MPRAAHGIRARPGRSAPGEHDAAVRRVLAVARAAVGAEVAWVAEFVGGRQVIAAASSGVPGYGPEEGGTTNLSESYGLRVLDGRLPNVVPDAATHPGTRDLVDTSEGRIGSFVGVPIIGADDRPRGMLCCANRTRDTSLVDQDLAVLHLLAGVLAELTQERRGSTEDWDAVRAQVAAAIEGEGRSCVLQPIVDIRSGDACGAEALARFDGAPFAPDQWFLLAEDVDLRVPLEVAAARSAVAQIDVLKPSAFLSINISPDALLSPAFCELLDSVDPSRIVLELTEHVPVEDYAVLTAALDRWRAAGGRLAVDDAGAGYASFRHILQLHPDFIKVDVSLVRGIAADPVRQALTSSLVTFARTVGAALIAEGVETQAELDTLARLGVTAMQGDHLAEPDVSVLPSGYPRPSRHVVVDGAADLGALLARAVRDSRDLASLSRPLLEATLRVTGLETSYLAVLSLDGRELEHRHVRNDGEIDLAEGTVPWSESLCSAMQERDQRWTMDAGRDLANHAIARDLGLQTFLSIPVVDVEGHRLGSLCAASRAPVFVSDASLAQVQLVAHVLAEEMTRDRRALTAARSAGHDAA